MTTEDREEILARIERLRVLIVSLEKSCEESAENRQTFDKLKRELDAAHRSLLIHRPEPT